MRKLAGVLLVAIAVVLVVQGVGWSITPSNFRVQGRITDSSGTAVTVTSVQYKLNTLPDGDWGSFTPGPWPTSWSNPVSGSLSTSTANPGVFEISIAATPATFQNNAIKFLINGSIETAEQRFTSVPYAYRAKFAESADISWPIVKSEAYTGRLLSISNTTAAGTNYSDNAAYFYSNANAGVRVEADRIGLLGTANYDPSAAPTDENLESAPNYGIWAGVSGKGYEVPGVGAISEKSYGIYAKTESAGKPGILGLGSRAGVEGRSSNDDFHFGSLGGTNPIKILGSTFKGITKAGAHGQVYDGNAYGILGYLHKTLSSDPDSGVPNFGVYARTIKGKDSAAVYGLATEGYGGHFTTYSKATRPGVYADSAQIGPKEEAPIIRTQAFTATFIACWPLVSWSLAVLDPAKALETNLYKNNMTKSLMFNLTDPDGDINIISIDRVAKIYSGAVVTDTTYFDYPDHEGTHATWDPVTQKLSVSRGENYPFVKAIKVFVTYSVIPERQLVPDQTTTELATHTDLATATTQVKVPMGSSLPATAQTGDQFILTNTAGNALGHYVYLTGMSWHRTAIDNDLTFNSLATTAGLKAMAQKANVTNAEISSTAGIATSKLSGAVTSIASNGLGTLATKNTVANADIATGAAIATSKLSGAVTSITSNGLGTLATKSSIANADIATGAVTSTKLADSAVTSTKLANSAVTSTKLANDAVTSAKIADGAITDAHFSTTINWGTIYTVPVIPAVPSDTRLKLNQKPVTGALENVVRLQATSFDWNRALKPELPAGRSIGVIAQEVEKVYPELVSEGADGYKRLNYDGLTAIALEAIKELKAENETLKARIQALEQKVR